jgi:hypothetical protein
LLGQYVRKEVAVADDQAKGLSWFPHWISIPSACRFVPAHSS